MSGFRRNSDGTQQYVDLLNLETSFVNYRVGAAIIIIASVTLAITSGFSNDKMAQSGGNRGAGRFNGGITMSGIRV